MCYFIVVGIPEETAATALRSLPAGLRAIPDSQYGGLNRWMSGCALFVVVEGMCACSLFTPKPKAPGRSRLKKLRRKYEQQGWSEAKIQRALADILNRPERDAGLRPGLADWIADIAEGAGRVYLYVHWASDKIARDPLRQALTPTAVRADPASVEEGRLITVSGG
ncbi:MAG: hypothetical protein AB1646_02065 [Thermodesulfobacteriota bacterium]